MEPDLVILTQIRRQVHDSCRARCGRVRVSTCLIKLSFWALNGAVTTFAGRVQALGSGGLGCQAGRVRLCDDACRTHRGESERARKHDRRRPVSPISCPLGLVQTSCNFLLDKLVYKCNCLSRGLASIFKNSRWWGTRINPDS